MSTINGKLGLKPAGKRSMMKLPADRALRATVTAAICPACQRTGARLSQTKPGWLVCSWCAQMWELQP